MRIASDIKPLNATVYSKVKVKTLQLVKTNRGKYYYCTVTWLQIHIILILNIDLVLGHIMLEITQMFCINLAHTQTDETTFTDYLLQLMLVFYLALVIYYQCHSYTLYKNTLVLRHHRPHTDRLTNWNMKKLSKY